MTRDQLLARFEIQGKRKARNFPFLMGEGVWKGSETLEPDDEVREVLRQGTLSIGFIGLAETLKCLIGHHHGESEEAQKLGLEIVGCIRRFCDEQSEKYGLNFTCLATPAEGLSGRFVTLDREAYGVIEGVTDREYYTNSFHIPVYFPISAAKKIRLEAPYHALTNAGHISYVELDGDTTKNLEAFEKIVRLMKESGIGYQSPRRPRPRVWLQRHHRRHLPTMRSPRKRDDCDGMDSENAGNLSSYPAQAKVHRMHFQFSSRFGGSGDILRGHSHFVKRAENNPYYGEPEFKGG